MDEKDIKEYTLDSWKENLDKLFKIANSAKVDIEEIHKCKAEMQQMKDDLYNNIHAGHYIHDDNRIVISAPEIVIGNVDKDGNLIGPSSVTIRSNGINLDGVGQHGSVNIRATTIRNRTEDPGIDGIESVVYSNASYTCRSGAILIDSTLTDGVFYRDFDGSSTGLTLRSDTSISINASLPISNSTGLKKSIKERYNLMKELAQKELKEITKTSGVKEATEKKITEIKAILSTNKLMETDELTDANVVAIEDLIEQLKGESSSFIGLVRSYIHALSEVVETKRKENALNGILSKLKDADHYKDNPTGALLSLNGETIIVSTRDGEGKIRENKDSGIIVDQVKNIDIKSKASTGAMIKDSHVQIESQDICLVTNDSKRDSKDKPMHFDVADGSIRMNSKNVVLTSYDYDTPDESNGDGNGIDSQFKMKQLTEKGKIVIGAASIDINTADQEGKAAGKVDVNSKSLVLQSVNKSKEESDDKVQLTDGGSTEILSKNICIGGVKAKDETKAEQILLTGKKVAMVGDSETEILQGTDKSNYILLKDNKLNAKNSKAQIFESSKHDLSGDVNVSKELKVKTATIGNLTAKASLKSPNQTDSGGTPLSVSTDKAENPDVE